MEARKRGGTFASAIPQILMNTSADLRDTMSEASGRRNTNSKMNCSRIYYVRELLALSSKLAYPLHPADRFSTYVYSIGCVPLFSIAICLYLSLRNILWYIEILCCIGSSHRKLAMNTDQICILYRCLKPAV